MTDIHPTAIVDSRARLAGDVSIGPFSIVGADVTLGAGVRVHSHVVIAGHTTVGARTAIHPFCSIGEPPQHMKYAGEPTRLLIGEDNVIREHVTMHTGTVQGGGVTRVGDKNLIMVGCHVAHDCSVGGGIVMANSVLLGGHVTVQDFVVFGGHCAVHQFCRVGRYAMVSGMTAVADDLVPYGLAYPVYSSRASLAGLNLIGLRRRGFSREQIHTLRTAYRLLFAEEGTMAERIDDVAGLHRDNEVVMEIVNFIRDGEKSSRSVMLPTTGRTGPAA
jgi:UDP-N-acetylglucosamine acyltransferase